MDGGQVALSADGATQFSAWMNLDSGKRRLFVSRGKPGEEPKATLVEYQGQQTHAVTAMLPDGRALVAFESGEGVAITLFSAEGKLEKQQELSQSARFPRVLATKTAAYVVWESGQGVQVCRIDATWWKPAD